VTDSDMRIDLLCIAPHTDDAEIGLGATLRLLADRERRVWVCDLTRGELASNATAEERWTEAAAASARLGLSGRLQLDLPDGFVSGENPLQAAAVTAIIRALRPRWIVCAPAPVRHPDHLATPALVARAVFLADLISFRPNAPALRGWPQAQPDMDGAERWRCEALLEVCPPGAAPSVIFDCSRTWPAKLEALACYASQFRRDPTRQPTAINDEGFTRRIEQQGRDWGLRAGVAYGEALRTKAVPVLTDLPREAWS
jgi:bacillithiol biosynthesis deacetylase BshB1